MPPAFDRNNKVRFHHLQDALELFQRQLDQQHADREKAAGILRRAELAALLGLHESTGKLNHEDLLTVIDHRLRLRLRLLLRERARRVWWRRLLRWLQKERAFPTPGEGSRFWELVHWT